MPKLGANLGLCADWHPSIPFGDALRQSTEWGLVQSPQIWIKAPADTPPATFNADGWATSLPPGFAVLKEIEGAKSLVPPGTYSLVVSGIGALILKTPSGVFQSTFTGPTVTDEVSIATPGLIQLAVTATDPTNPLTAQLLFPGHTSADTFYKPLLSALAPFTGAIRLKDWQRTNTTTVTSWAQRTLPTYHTQAIAGGVAIEHCCALANALNRDLWLTVPVQADDEWHRQAAALVKALLNPHLKCRIEFGNEVWNFAFPYGRDAGWVLDQAKAAGVDNATMTGRLAGRVFAIWKAVLGAALVRVAAWHIGDGLLAKLLAALGPGGYDAIAIAPYAQPSKAAYAGFSASTTPQQIMSSCLTEMRLRMKRMLGVTAAIRNQVAPGVPLWGYEGILWPTCPPIKNPDGSQQPQPWYPAFAAAAELPDTGPALAEAFEICDEAGVEELAYYTLCGPMSADGWGSLLTNLNDLNTPMYDAAVMAAE